MKIKNSNIPIILWKIGNIIVLPTKFFLSSSNYKSGCYKKHPPSKWHPHMEGLPISSNVLWMPSSIATSLECLEWPPTEKLDTHPHQWISKWKPYDVKRSPLYMRYMKLSGFFPKWKVPTHKISLHPMLNEVDCISPCFHAWPCWPSWIQASHQHGEKQEVETYGWTCTMSYHTLPIVTTITKPSASTPNHH